MNLQLAWSQARHVLCVRLGSASEMLCSGPAIRALKEALPGRKITVLASSAGARMAQRMPEVDDVMTYDAVWSEGTPFRPDSRPEWKLVEDIWKLRCDASVIFTAETEQPIASAMLCYLAGIRLRAAHCHHAVHQLITHRVVETPGAPLRHDVRRQLDLVANLRCATRDERLAVVLPPKARASTLALLESLGVDVRRPWIVIQPTSNDSGAMRNMIAEVARMLSFNMQQQVLWLGQESDANVVHALQQAMASPSNVLVGQLTETQQAALLSLAPVFLTTSPQASVVSSAVGTPVVAMLPSGSTFAPWGVEHRLVTPETPSTVVVRSLMQLGKAQPAVPSILVARQGNNTMPMHGMQRPGSSAA